MASGQLRGIIGQLRRIVGRRGGCTLTDAQLLEAFVSRRDQASFEVLVWRHGAMVLNLCERVLRDRHEAEDAFQAVFLIFARKARSIGKRAAVASWLYKPKELFKPCFQERPCFSRRHASEARRSPGHRQRTARATAAVVGSDAGTECRGTEVGR